MRGGAKAPRPLVTRGLRTLVPDWHWLRGCLLGPSVQNQASRWHFCSVLMLAVKRSPPWRQKAAGPGLSRGAAASAPAPAPSAGPPRGRAAPPPSCLLSQARVLASPGCGCPRRTGRAGVPAPRRPSVRPAPPTVHLLCLAPEGSAVFSAPWCTPVTALRWDSGRRGSVRPRALLAGTPLCSGAWLAPLPDPPREVALASP